MCKLMPSEVNVAMFSNDEFLWPPFVLTFLWNPINLSENFLPNNNISGCTIFFWGFKEHCQWHISVTCYIVLSSLQLIQCCCWTNSSLLRPYHPVGVLLLLLHCSKAVSCAFNTFQLNAYFKYFCWASMAYGNMVNAFFYFCSILVQSRLRWAWKIMLISWTSIPWESASHLILHQIFTEYVKHFCNVFVINDTGYNLHVTRLCIYSWERHLSQQSHKGNFHFTAPFTRCIHLLSKLSKM